MKRTILIFLLVTFVSPSFGEDPIFEDPIPNPADPIVEAAIGDDVAAIPLEPGNPGPGLQGESPNADLVDFPGDSDESKDAVEAAIEEEEAQAKIEQQVQAQTEQERNFVREENGGINLGQPPLEIQQPAPEQVLPVEQQPQVEQQQQVEQQPPVEIQPPVEQQPAVEIKTPVEQQPAVEIKTPVEQHPEVEQQPPVKIKTPVEQHPEVEQQIPAEPPVVPQVVNPVVPDASQNLNVQQPGGLPADPNQNVNQANPNEPSEIKPEVDPNVPIVNQNTGEIPGDIGLQPKVVEPAGPQIPNLEVNDANQNVASEIKPEVVPAPDLPVFNQNTDQLPLDVGLQPKVIGQDGLQVSNPETAVAPDENKGQETPGVQPSEMEAGDKPEVKDETPEQEQVPVPAAVEEIKSEEPAENNDGNDVVYGDVKDKTDTQGQVDGDADVDSDPNDDPNVLDPADGGAKDLDDEDQEDSQGIKSNEEEDVDEQKNPSPSDKKEDSFSLNAKNPEGAWDPESGKQGPGVWLPILLTLGAVAVGSVTWYFIRKKRGFLSKYTRFGSNDRKRGGPYTTQSYRGGRGRNGRSNWSTQEETFDEQEEPRYEEY